MMFLLSLFYCQHGNEDPHVICIVQLVPLQIGDEAPGENQILMRTGIIIQHNIIISFIWTLDLDIISSDT